VKLTVGRLDDARKASPKWVEARLAYDDMADGLRDEGVELSAMLAKGMKSSTTLGDVP
jgi:hypothetical protein